MHVSEGLVSFVLVTDKVSEERPTRGSNYRSSDCR